MGCLSNVPRKRMSGGRGESGSIQSSNFPIVQEKIKLCLRNRPKSAFLTAQAPRPLREGKLVTPWIELPAEILCDLAEDCDLVPRERLMIGRMCLDSGAPELAIPYLERAGREPEFRAESEALRVRARKAAGEAKALQAVAVTSPPWPGEDEAVGVIGRWDPA